MVTRELLVHKVCSATLVQQAHKELKEIQVPRDLKVFKETLAPRVRKAYKVPQVLQDCKETPALLDHKEFRAPQVQQDRKVYREIQDPQAHKEL
jgi:hypothetical protein